MLARQTEGLAPADADASDLLRKQNAFLSAIERYETVPVYRFTGILVSIANVSMQVWLVFRAARDWSGLLPEVAAFLAAILVADFVNGFVHLVMDRAGGYGTIVGPFVANFHMHHRIPVYRRRNLFLVYFFESGSKFWLVAYLGVVAWFLPALLHWGPTWAHFFVLVGLFSSWAEVSHYMCHTTNSKFQGALERTGLILPKVHHSRHHAEDNVHYAFLNGWTNPVLNGIAKLLSNGYKHTTDLHTALYQAKSRS